LIGTVQSVGSAQQRKMFVTFHRAVCPDGFSLDFDKYIGLDPLGTTGLATKVDTQRSRSVYASPMRLKAPW
jgi:type IV secretion system protein VirB10